MDKVPFCENVMKKNVLMRSWKCWWNVKNVTKLLTFKNKKTFVWEILFYENDLNFWNNNKENFEKMCKNDEWTTDILEKGDVKLNNKFFLKMKRICEKKVLMRW